MSADELRQAAETLRGQADAAILASGDDPWGFTGIGWNEQMGTTYTVKAGEVHVAEANTEEQAVWVATMHPGVGLALADLLDEAASYREQQRSLLARTFGDDKADDFMPKPEPHSLSIARLINGGAA